MSGLILPTLDAWNIEVEEVENAPNRLVHNISDRLRMVVEGRDRRRDDCPDFGKGREAAKVSEMERRFAKHKDKAAVLLEDDICSASEQRASDAMSDARHCLNRTRRDNHSHRAE